jgi:hypothetical protein
MAIALLGSVGSAAAQQAPAANPTPEQAGADPRMATPSTEPAGEHFYKLSDQAAPAKYSARNADQDAHWWLDRGTAFTDQQKLAIRRAIGDRGTPVPRGAGLHPEPSAEVPADIKLRELPNDLKAQIPFLKDFKYVLTQDRKIVLIDPDDSAVAAVIAAQKWQTE